MEWIKWATLGTTVFGAVLAAGIIGCTKMLWRHFRSEGRLAVTFDGGPEILKVTLKWLGDGQAWDLAVFPLPGGVMEPKVLTSHRLRDGDNEVRFATRRPSVIRCVWGDRMHNRGSRWGFGYRGMDIDTGTGQIRLLARREVVGAVRQKDR